MFAVARLTVDGGPNAAGYPNGGFYPARISADGRVIAGSRRDWIGRDETAFGEAEYRDAASAVRWSAGIRAKLRPVDRMALLSHGAVQILLPEADRVAALALAVWFLFAGRGGRAFAMTALATVALVATLFAGLYPRVMVSSTDFADSLTVEGAASSHYALAVMSVVAVVLVPVVLVYQGWTYYVFRHRVGDERITG